MLNIKKIGNAEVNILQGSLGASVSVIEEMSLPF